MCILLSSKYVITYIYIFTVNSRLHIEKASQPLVDFMTVVILEFASTGHLSYHVIIVMEHLP